MCVDSSDIKITKTKSPSYLKTLLNNVEDIILIHKINDTTNESSYVATPTKIKNEEEDPYLDVTGSPLKVDLNNSSFLSVESVNFNNFWHKNEEKYHPLFYKDAMNHIQTYIQKNFKKEENTPTWWLLDGTNKDRTILISSLQLSESITRSTVKLNGYLPKNHPSIAFESLCNKHFEIVENIAGKMPKVPLRQLAANISTTYELFGSKISSVNFDEKNDIQGSVYLEISWNQCCAEIPHHSKNNMSIQTVVGQQSSFLSQFWKELILLELYIKALSEYDSETMQNNHWLPYQSEFSNDSDLIERVVETVRNCQDVPRCNINKDDEIELVKIIDNVEKRYTFDITDQLWSILNKCSTYGALNDCLNIVFTEIINMESNSYITDSNMTSMAQIIRDIVAGKTSVFMLTGTQPIEILIDIGLEKLRKDFSYIFTQFGICTEQDLQSLFNIPSRQNNALNKEESKQIRAALYHKKSLLNMENVESRMKILGQLHTVLETLILVPSFWQPLTCKTIFEYYIGDSSPIDSFSDLARNKLYEINVDLHDNKVHENVKTLTPIMWRLTLTSLKKNSCSVKNIFHLSQQPIFPPTLYKPEVMNETVGAGDMAYYHYTLLTEITNFIRTNFS